MYKPFIFSLLIFLLFSDVQSQECFFLKNVPDTLYQIDPATGILNTYPTPVDYPNQTYYGYLSAIDPIGRRYMYVTLLSDTSFDDFGLKIIDLDSLTTTSVLLSGYENVSPGTGQFSFHGLEYGAVTNSLYLAPVTGDSLYQIDLNSGAVSATQPIPGFSNTYSYLHTFHQSQQQYSMIAMDNNGQKRFFRIDMDDDTTYVSPPMSFPEPLRGLEVSEATGQYFVVCDADQMFYEVDPVNGTLSPMLSIPSYMGAFGYLHTFDYSTDQYLMVGLDSNPGNFISLYSIFPSDSTISQVPFPTPQAGFFGLEAANTQFLAKMVSQPLSPEETEPQLPVAEIYPNPAIDKLTIVWSEEEYVDVEIIDFSGDMYFQEEIFSNGECSISVEGIPPGEYLLTVKGQQSDLAGAQWLLIEN